MTGSCPGRGLVIPKTNTDAMKPNKHLLQIHADAMAKKRYWREQQKTDIFPNPRTMWMVSKFTQVERGLRRSIYQLADEQISDAQLYRDLSWQHH